MTQLGALVLTLALQTTLVSVLACGLIVCVRRRAGAALTVLTTLSALLPIMAAATFLRLPVPALPAVDASIETSEPPSRPADRATTTPAPRTALPLRELVRWLPRPEALPRSAPSSSSVLALLAVAYLGVLGLGLCRLIIGLRALIVLRRRSQHLSDPAVRADMDYCRARLGMRLPVALRECTEPGLTAVVGWWKPVVLLPPEWRSWQAEDRRAALAHELAHVAGRHYLVTLVARCGAILHAYHPLVCWLCHRLRWEQEVAADARAIEILGRRPYLCALARIALMRRPHGSFARVFHAPAMDGGALSRRIAMIRNGVARRSLSRIARWCLVAALVTGVAVAQLLRSPQAPAEPAPAPPAPYDFRYVGIDDPDGVEVVVCAFRPAEVLTQPGMEVVRKLSDTYVGPLAGKPDLRLPDALRAENFEQVVAGLVVGSKKSEKAADRMMLGLTTVMLRLKVEFDWLGFVKDLGGTVTECRAEGQTYYRIADKLPVLGLYPICFVVPDSKTLVLWLKQGEGMEREFAGRVARARDRITRPGREAILAAPVVLLLGAPSELVQSLAEAEQDDSAAAKILHVAGFLGIGIEVGQKQRIKILAETENAEAAAMLAQAVRRDCDALRGPLEEALKMVYGEARLTQTGVVRTGDARLQFAWHRLASDLLRSAEFQREGANLRCAGDSSVSLRELIESLRQTVFAAD
jgi:beta-lactamase regulating signal transducer with metallopeptidase domain